MQNNIKYQSDGPSGHVIYDDGRHQFKMYYEFGGGDCVVIVFIPTLVAWETTTGISINDRDLVLDSIASQVLKDQVPNGSYKISDRYIEFYHS